MTKQEIVDTVLNKVREVLGGAFGPNEEDNVRQRIENDIENLAEECLTKVENEVKKFTGKQPTITPPQPVFTNPPQDK